MADGSAPLNMYVSPIDRARRSASCTRRQNCQPEIIAFANAFTSLPSARPLPNGSSQMPLATTGAAVKGPK